MKGVIFSTSFFILIFATFFSLGWYVNFDHNRSVINNNLKKSLFQTAHLLSAETDLDEEMVIDHFVNEINGSLPSNFDYKVELLGFNADPILMRIKILCKSKNNLYSFTLEETLIEKEILDAKE